MVTNPLDVLTYHALKASGLPANQVFGTGTTLDSSRFRHFLANDFNVATESMGAYLIGEHGDSSVPVVSHSNIMGEPLASFPQFSQDKVEKAYLNARNAASNIISKKGFTCFAIALAVSRIVRSILYDENHVFPLSVYLTGQYGIKDVCLSLPAIVGRTGIKNILDLKLTKEEAEKLQNSADIVRETINGLAA
jgi:L-lactate dehydrogenase